MLRGKALDPMQPILEWFKAGSPPHYGYIIVGVLLFLDWLLPRIKKPDARSVIELIANLLRMALGKVPGVGGLLSLLGSPKTNTSSTKDVLDGQGGPGSPSNISGTIS